jgi:hypothetical protein
VDPIAPLDHFLEQDGDAERIDRRVALDLVHRLADANSRSQMNHRLDVVQRTAYGGAVANVANDKLDLGIEVGGTFAFGMDLRSRLSKARTATPPTSTRSATCEPMNPAPPVTSTLVATPEATTAPSRSG